MILRALVSSVEFRLPRTVHQVHGRNAPGLAEVALEMITHSTRSPGKTWLIRYHRQAGQRSLAVRWLWLCGGCGCVVVVAVRWLWLCDGCGCVVVVAVWW